MPKSEHGKKNLPNDHLSCAYGRMANCENFQRGMITKK
jgi:hypothetical protein